MTDLSNKPISYTGSHPLELPYRALSARAEAAEALAYERLEDMLFAEQRATDADLRAEAAEAEAARLAARVAELEAAQQWQPGSSEPPKSDWYWVFDFTEDDVPMHRFHRGNGRWGMHGEYIAPDWWLPIPPLPQEPTP